MAEECEILHPRFDSWAGLLPPEIASDNLDLPFLPKAGTMEAITDPERSRTFPLFENRFGLPSSQNIRTTYQHVEDWGLHPVLMLTSLSSTKRSTQCLYKSITRSHVASAHSQMTSSCFEWSPCLTSAQTINAQALSSTDTGCVSFIFI